LPNAEDQLILNFTLVSSDCTFVSLFTSDQTDLKCDSPRHGEPSDEVRLRGEPSLIAKLKVELEKIVADLRDRVVLGVDVPVAQHRVLIGRGGQNLNELQNRFRVQIQIPGSRTYEHVGEPGNVANLSDVDPANIVKVSGARGACEKAIAQLQVCC
jgi:hypothetical protein